ncbi:MAG TPA: HAD-IB family hydrolase [Ilumatobacter sp.]|nr:HAD-IB family hydrolase [Ilumatobacter sp.]
MTGAAFFDLDRTLLRGASGPVLSDALRAAGLVSRTIPGERLLYEVFNRYGELLPSMALARQAARLAAGHSRGAVVAAAESVAPRLVELVQPFAESVFEQHRDQGRPIVLATTTPYDLVKPFADLLGLDDVVATRYEVGDDGDTYTGGLTGPFTWATGKLAAVRAWATEHGVDLADSFAYSDSVYDAPLLNAVGHPVAVNPDPRLRLLAVATRWPTLHLDVPPGVVKVPLLGVELQRLALPFAGSAVAPFAHVDVRGADHIPATGPVILVGNHRSYFDTMVMAMVVARSGRMARFLGKREVFDAPVIGQMAAAFGGIPVARGTGSDAPLRAAINALEAGELVALMPQGTIPRGPAFFDPELKGRWGAARLAAATGAPVIPVGLWGTELVWPRSARVPNLFNPRLMMADPPDVSATVGPPVALKHKSPEADTRRIMKAIGNLLPAEARTVRTPTAEELARTYPPGYRGDPEAEAVRRPGRDT